MDGGRKEKALPALQGPVSPSKGLAVEAYLSPDQAHRLYTALTGPLRGFWGPLGLN